MSILIKKIITNKISFSRKRVEYFLGYRDDGKAKPLFIMLPKINEYVKNFDETKCMYFLIEDGKLLKKCNEHWVKVSNNIKKDLIVSQSNICLSNIISEKYLKNKVKSYEGKINASFHGDGAEYHVFCYSLEVIPVFH